MPDVPTYRIQTSLQDHSGLARDQYVTTVSVHFTATPTAPQLDAACAAPEAFFENIRTYLSPVIAQNGHTSKAYLLGAPIGTPPASSRVWDFAAATAGEAFPSEVACCLTFHGSPQPGVRRQSWRGRFYVGPLNYSAENAGAPTDERPGIAFRNAMVSSALTMASTLNTTGKWVIASKVLNQVFPVATVSCDDAWDTMRSRGSRPTGRVVGVIPGGGGGSGPW